jgi:hypothetical protein
MISIEIGNIQDIALLIQYTSGIGFALVEQRDDWCMFTCDAASHEHFLHDVIEPLMVQFPDVFTAVW